MSRLANPGLPEQQPAAKRLRPSPGPLTPEDDPDSSAAHQGSMQYSNMQVNPRPSLLAYIKGTLKPHPQSQVVVLCTPTGQSREWQLLPGMLLCDDSRAQCLTGHDRFCSNSDNDGCRRCISQRL